MNEESIMPGLKAMTNNELIQEDKKLSKQLTNIKKKKKRTFWFCKLIIFGIFLINVIVCSGFFYSLYNEYEYETIFDDVSITSESDDKFLPEIKVKFQQKHIVFTHNLVPSNTHNRLKKFSFYQKVNNFFNGMSKMVNRLLYSDFKKNEYFHLHHGHKFNFEIKQNNDQTNSSLNEEISCLKVKVLNNMKKATTGEIEACVNLNNYSWFGGHESLNEPYWPINKQNFDYVPYVTGYTDEWGALVERYWLSSAGLAIFFDDNIPLLVKHSDPNTICFKSSRSAAPYAYTPEVYTQDQLEYNVCTGPIKKLHLSMLEKFMSYPKSFPDSLMMKLPVFTTWNYFFKDINQSSVLSFAHEIRANNYSISQLEIDDKWEEYYGDLDFDKNKFPNVSEMVSVLHKMNMRTTLWVHPFCNIDSKCFVEGSNKNYWVTDLSGKNPALTSWWNGPHSGIIDTTNPTAVEYFTNKLNFLKTNYGIDSFKFDAGETSWCPHVFKYFDKKAYPDAYSQNYIKLAAKQNNYIEARAAHRVQETPIFFRILDRSTDWTIHDGLKSVITATLQFGLLGYPFVLPDIIGGNSGLNDSNKELFIRWTQLTAFLPAMQFGVPPWYFDQETNKICKHYVDLHENLVYPYIKKLPLDGSPIIRPIWWLEPENDVIYKINDQFLIGNDFLVAPVLDPNVTTRQIYFPKGVWYDTNTLCKIEGPINLNFKVTMDNIPYFISKEYAIILKLNSSFKKCSFEF